MMNNHTFLVFPLLSQNFPMLSYAKDRRNTLFRRSFWKGLDINRKFSQKAEAVGIPQPGHTKSSGSSPT